MIACTLPAGLPVCRLPAIPASAPARSASRPIAGLLGRVTVRAVDWSVSARLEGDLRILPALGADRREHLPLSAPAAAVTTRGVAAAAVATTTLRLPGRPALRASAWLVLQSTTRVELLLAGRENECCPTISTGQVLVGVSHYVVSSLDTKVGTDLVTSDNAEGSCFASGSEGVERQPLGHTQEATSLTTFISIARLEWNGKLRKAVWAYSSDRAPQIAR